MKTVINILSPAEMSDEDIKFLALEIMENNHRHGERFCGHQKFITKIKKAIKNKEAQIESPTKKFILKW